MDEPSERQAFEATTGSPTVGEAKSPSHLESNRVSDSVPKPAASFKRISKKFTVVPISEKSKGKELIDENLRVSESMPPSPSRKLPSCPLPTVQSEPPTASRPLPTVQSEPTTDHTGPSIPNGDGYFKESPSELGVKPNGGEGLLQDGIQLAENRPEFSIVEIEEDRAANDASVHPGNANLEDCEEILHCSVVSSDAGQMDSNEALLELIQGMPSEGNVLPSTTLSHNIHVSANMYVSSSESEIPVSGSEQEHSGREASSDTGRDAILMSSSPRNGNTQIKYVKAKTPNKKKQKRSRQRRASETEQGTSENVKIVVTRRKGSYDTTLGGECAPGSPAYGRMHSVELATGNNSPNADVGKHTTGSVPNGVPAQSCIGSTPANELPGANSDLKIDDVSFRHRARVSVDRDQSVTDIFVQVPHYEALKLEEDRHDWIGRDSYQNSITSLASLGGLAPYATWDRHNQVEAKRKKRMLQEQAEEEPDHIKEPRTLKKAAEYMCEHRPRFVTMLVALASVIVAAVVTTHILFDPAHEPFAHMSYRFEGEWLKIVRIARGGAASDNEPVNSDNILKIDLDVLNGLDKPFNCTLPGEVSQGRECYRWKHASLTFLSVKTSTIDPGISSQSSPPSENHHELESSVECHEVSWLPHVEGTSIDQIHVEPYGTAPVLSSGSRTVAESNQQEGTTPNSEAEPGKLNQSSQSGLHNDECGSESLTETCARITSFQHGYATHLRDCIHLPVGGEWVGPVPLNPEVLRAPRCVPVSVEAANLSPLHWVSSEGLSITVLSRPPIDVCIGHGQLCLTGNFTAEGAARGDKLRYAVCHGEKSFHVQKTAQNRYLTVPVATTAMSSTDSSNRTSESSRTSDNSTDTLAVSYFRQGISDAVRKAVEQPVFVIPGGNDPTAEEDFRRQVIAKDFNVSFYDDGVNHSLLEFLESFSGVNQTGGGNMTKSTASASGSLEDFPLDKILNISPLVPIQSDEFQRHAMDYSMWLPDAIGRTPAMFSYAASKKVERGLYSVVRAGNSEISAAVASAFDRLLSQNAASSALFVNFAHASSTILRDFDSLPSFRQLERLRQVSEYPLVSGSASILSQSSVVSLPNEESHYIQNQGRPTAPTDPTGASMQHGGEASDGLGADLLAVPPQLLPVIRSYEAPPTSLAEIVERILAAAVLGETLVNAAGDHSAILESSQPVSATEAPLAVTPSDIFLQWLSIAAITPFIRFSEPPWVYGQNTEQRVREILSRRSEAFSEATDFSTLEAEASARGESAFHPLWYAFPDDSECNHVHSEFMIGNVYLAAPALRLGDFSREVCFPRGVWKNANLSRGESEYIFGPVRKMIVYEPGHLPLFRLIGSLKAY